MSMHLPQNVDLCQHYTRNQPSKQPRRAAHASTPAVTAATAKHNMCKKLHAPSIAAGKWRSLLLLFYR
jgi:hypothetical protein